MDDHTNASLPTGIKISRKGDRIILKLRTATIHLPRERAGELARALLEISS